MLPSLDTLEAITAPRRTTGVLKAVRGAIAIAHMPAAALGQNCEIILDASISKTAEVVGFEDQAIKLALFEHSDGLAPGQAVRSLPRGFSLPLSRALLGRVINSRGEPLDGAAKLEGLPYPARRAPPQPFTRRCVDTALSVGIRGIDALCPIGEGQRVGVIAPAGTGKTTLLGMIARNACADLNVIALVGERGREVREFVERGLGTNGLQRSVVVVSTSDESPLSRMYAALSATAIAEYFRDQGARVLLMIDSLTRFARALRDLGLSCGELPVRHGFTPSVYNELPQLLERAGRSGSGSISAIYTLLSESEQQGDPLAHEVKSLLDGHLVLDGALAERGRRPAIDYTLSLSRLSAVLQTQAQLDQARTLRRALIRLKDEKEMLLFGAEPDAEFKKILEHEKKIEEFLSQSEHQSAPRSETMHELAHLAALIRDAT